MASLIRRVRRWWRRRQYRFDECEVCGKRSRHNVTLTAERDRSGGGLVGGSSISATFCPEHLPGTEYGRGVAEGIRRETPRVVLSGRLIAEAVHKNRREKP